MARTICLNIITWSTVAHLLHGQADVTAQIFTRVQRSYIEVAAKIDGNVGGAAPVIVFKQIKLALGSHVAGETQFFEPAVHAAEKAAAVAAKGSAVRLFHIAEKLHHPAFGRAPGQDGHGGQVRPEHKVAFFHVHKTGNGAAVKTDAVFQSLGQVAGQHGNVLLGAEDIAKGEPHEFDVVVLNEIKDILLGRIAHDCFPFT